MNESVITIYGDVLKDKDDRIRALEAERTELKRIVWDAISPYIASEYVAYSEEEMACLCENILPTMWIALVEASHE